ncbi:MAG: histidine kinase dimerization/phospho-acceptor domain-containing protein, partial [Olleya sp.]
MSCSLIGIILVQAYYINNALQNTDKQFNFNVKKALSYVSNTIENQEKEDYLIKFTELLNQGSINDTTAIINIYIKEDNSDSNETVIYRNGILEENFKVSSALFDIGLDSLNVKRILQKRETEIIENNTVDGSKNLSSMLSKLSKLNESTQIALETVYKDKAYLKPIHKRVDLDKIDRLLTLKLLEDDINIGYEFAIYSNDLSTKIRTQDFQYEKASTFSVPFFYNENDKNNYRLLVNFPERQKFIFSSILTMLILSIVFTLIIIIAYSSALYQLIKQRQISQIKTDFINNMTHEFKTPIATINLALDSIRNPKIIDDKEKVLRYLGMIKEENKRMHAQVENVLRISKLEKNELNISKERVELNDLVEDAITHV